MRVLQHRRQSGSRRDAVVARALRALPRLPRPCAFVAGTAAWLHGVDVLPPGVDERVWPLQAALTRRPPTLVLDVEPRYWRIDAVDVCVVDGLPTTTPERTLFDCARTLPRLDAVAAVDRLLRFDLDPVACGRLYRQLLNEPDAVRMRSALAVRDVRSQSPLESWGRCLVQDAGLPRPTPQLPAPVAGGRTMHLDLGYKAFRLGVEFDGFQHHSKPADVAYDRRRRGLLVDSGWHVAVFTGSTVLNDPEAMLSAILDLLLERGWRPPSRQLARIRKRIRHVAACMEAGHDTW